MSSFHDDFLFVPEPNLEGKIASLIEETIQEKLYIEFAAAIGLRNAQSDEVKTDLLDKSSTVFGRYKRIAYCDGGRVLILLFSLLNYYYFCFVLKKFFSPASKFHRIISSEKIFCVYYFVSLL